MIRPALPALILLLSGVVRPAHAQLIGPIPPAPTAAPNPSGPAPGEVKPPPSEPDAPSIVELDNGRLKPLSAGADETAVARYPFDGARRARIAASLQSRAADMDRFVITNLERVLEAESLAPKVRSAGDFNALFKARDAVAALRFERPLDRLLRDGAITLEHKTRLDEAVRGYDAARKKQHEADSAGDPARAAVLALRQTFDDVVREPLASLNRQLATMADHADEVLAAIPPQDAQAPAVGALKAELAKTTEPARQREMLGAFWRNTLSAEQKRAALTTARGIASPPPPPPAKP